MSVNDVRRIAQQEIGVAGTVQAVEMDYDNLYNEQVFRFFVAEPSGTALLSEYRVSAKTTPETAALNWAADYLAR